MRTPSGGGSPESSRRLGWRLRCGTGILSAATFLAIGAAIDTQPASAAPASASLSVPNYSMTHSLDCEAAALQVALAGVHINVSQDWILGQMGADTRPPVFTNGVVTQWGDPYQSFVGNVNGSMGRTGYGVYYPPIVRAAQAAGAIADGGEGWTPSQLYDQVSVGHPVVVWVPHLLENAPTSSYTAWDGRQVWYSPDEHAQVLVAYNYNAGTVTLEDDFDGTFRTFPMSLFQARFAAWNSSAVVIERPPLLGNYVGNGKSGLAYAPGSATSVAASTGSGFSSPALWSNSPFYGSRPTLAADFSGDGKTDLLAMNDNNTWIEQSSGSGFSAPAEWSSTPFYGTKATLAADLTGNGRADLIAVNDNSTWVMLPNGSGLDAPVEWSSTPFYGNVSIFAAEVSGDNKADLIAVDGGSTWVMTSTGSGFSSPAEWASTPFYGTQATLACALSGGSKSDLVAVNSSGTWVMSPSGASFTSPQEWSSSPFYGSAETLCGDVDGDGNADLIAINSESTFVMFSTGSGFSGINQWSAGPRVVTPQVQTSTPTPAATPSVTPATPAATPTPGDSPAPVSPSSSPTVTATPETPPP